MISNSSTLGSTILQHQAHIWIGDAQTIQQELIAQIQKIICPKQGCLSCNVCQQVAQEQHPWIINVNPESSYTLNDIDKLLEQIRFTLDFNEYRFIIFTRAQELSAACSNRLLKTIEEPHRGYYFIFAAQNTDTILPTIMSRCFVQEFTSTVQSSRYKNFLDFFIENNWNQPLLFLKTVEQLEINHQTSKDIIDQLIIIMHQRLKNSHQNCIDNNFANTKELMFHLDQLVILQQHLSLLPLTGAASVKAFWKNIFLQFHLQSIQP
jgi:hypothetical protein